MLKKHGFLIALLLMLPILGFSQVSRLITVDTPYVDTDKTIKLSLLSFKPLNVQGNFNFLGDLIDFSVDTTLPFWFLDSPNFGAKVAINLPLAPVTVAVSYHFLNFIGEDQVLSLVSDKATDMPVTINSATLNFHNSKLDVMAGVDFKLFRVYGIFDTMIYGNDNGTYSYVHPVIGGDIKLLFLNIFAELGYYIPTGEEPMNEISGILSTQMPSDFTAGLGVEMDLALLNIVLGVQYPGMVVQYGVDPEADVLDLPVIPYFNISLQF